MAVELHPAPRRLHVYIAGPLGDESPTLQQQNVERAIQAGVAVYRHGHIPFIPHLSQQVLSYLEATSQEPLTYDQYIDWDLALLMQCDVLYFLGSSPGADLERRCAHEWGLEVITSLAQIPRLEIAVYPHQELTSWP